MLLTKHQQKNQENKDAGLTFRMIPISKNSPYLVCEFDLSNKMLVMCSDTITEDLQVIPHLGKDGQPVPLKSPKGQYSIEVERRMIPNLWEIHLTDNESIIEFINLVAVNAETFNFRALLSNDIQVKSKPELITTLS